MTIPTSAPEELVSSLSPEALEQDGYLLATRFENGRNAAIMPFLFTWAIVSDLTENGYEDRWCYETLGQAVEALNQWNGESEPQGWHRHPMSGRRRDHDGNELGAW